MSKWVSKYLRCFGNKIFLSESCRYEGGDISSNTGPFMALLLNFGASFKTITLFVPFNDSIE